MTRGGMVALALSGWVVWVYTLEPRTTQSVFWEIDSSHATYEACVGYLKDLRTRAEQQRGVQRPVEITERPGVLRIDDTKFKTVKTAYCLPGTVDPRDKTAR
jgi:hypothetical protein